MNQINLDINKSGQIINEPVVLRVGDKDQAITVNLLKDGQPYTSFTTATFFANKPSGAIVANDPANISSGTITYTVPQALVNEFGKITNAYFLIDGKVSTESFVIAILQGVNISDDLNDYIPGMSNLNVIYDKWKTKLDSITKEMAGIDAPKEVQNVVNNVLKDYANQLNDLKGKLNTLQSDVNNLKVPKIGGRNLIIRNGEIPDTIVGTDANIIAFPGSSLMNSYIDVTPGEYLTFQVWGAYGKAGQAPDNSIRFAYYDGSNELISRQLLSSYPTTLSVPNNAAKIQISYPTLMKVKVEAGNTPTDWTPAPEDKVNVSDTANWQKQKITQDGAFYYATCPSRTDFGAFLESDSVPVGFSIIRDGNSNMNWRIIKENSLYIYGLCQDTTGAAYHLEVMDGAYQGYKKVISNLMGQTITATDDAGKTVKLKVTGIS